MAPIAVSTATQTEASTSSSSPLTLKLRAAANADPDYVRQLDAQGFAVVKGVLDERQAAEYVDRANAWLEGFGKGFDRNDRETWHADKLPPHRRGGLYNGLGVAKEQLLWDIRSEPELIKVFEKLWGTDELLVSFDGANFSIPLPASEIQDGGKPWPHVDQSPLKREKQCIQGIMNLAPNGPEDGGLMVLEGSFSLYKEFFDSHDHDQPEGGWPTYDSYHHTESQLQWFYDRGCTWKHVDAAPGDVILWDSRCIHYGAAPKGQNARYATYVCYKPANMISPEQLELKKKAYHEARNTSHDPATFRVVPLFDDMTPIRTKPLQETVLSKRAQQLAGLVAY